MLILGDSSVFGHAIPDGRTLHDQLQQRLGRDGIPARVRRAAAPGYTTVQSRVAFDEVGWRLGPSLLVVANWWSDSHLDRYRDAEVLARRWVGEASALCGLLRQAVDRGRGGEGFRRVGWPTAAAGVRRVPLADHRAHLDALLDEARSRGVGVAVRGLPHAAWVASGDSTTGAGAPYRALRGRGAGLRRLRAPWAAVHRRAAPPGDGSPAPRAGGRRSPRSGGVAGRGAPARSRPQRGPRVRGPLVAGHRAGPRAGARSAAGYSPTTVHA